MRVFFKVGSVVLTLMLLFLLGACGSLGNSSKKVYFASYAPAEDFTGELYQAVESEVQAMGCEIEFVNANHNANLQTDQVKEMVDEKPLAIILLAADPNTLIPAVEYANKAGVPIITTNRDLNGGEFSSVMTDEVQAGKLQGEYMAKHLPQNANVVYLSGETSQDCARERFEGFKTACLDKRPDVTLLAKSASGDWSEAEGIRDLTLWMQMGHIDAVIAANDCMALGALKALQNAGRSDGVMISGIDATAAGVQAIRNGTMVQTVKQDLKTTAQEIVKLLKEISEGKQSGQQIRIPTVSITRESL